MYEQPGMGEHTLNPVVGETNDSLVNNMWADPVGKSEVFAALDSATENRVARSIHQRKPGLSSGNVVADPSSSVFATRTTKGEH